MWSHLVTTVSSLLFHKQITWGEPSLDARYTLLALGILLLSCFHPFFTIWTILNISNIIHFFNRVYPHHSSHENTEMNIENATVEDVTKALIHFISARNSQPFWRYEYITKSVWTIKSAEQIDNFVQHILRVFEMSLPPNAHLAERWSQLSLQVNLCQKLLFLHLLTHNMTKDYKFYTWKIQAQTWEGNVVYRKCFWHSEIFCTQHVLPIFCKKKSFWQRFTCTVGLILFIKALCW